jgi:hypothetical protein
MRGLLCLLLTVVTVGAVEAQTLARPYPTGMRVVVGPDGSVPRNAPWGTCGTDNHQCIAGDSVAPGVYAVVQADAPILDSGGMFYWIRVIYAQPSPSGLTQGWSRAIPPFLAMLTPPQMTEGVAFTIMADYLGPTLTQGVCINDGAGVAATLALKATTLADGSPGQIGSMSCPWPKAGLGNHKVVVQALNTYGTTAAPEFQFIVSTSPILQPPVAPTNVRIQ